MRKENTAPTQAPKAYDSAVVGRCFTLLVQGAAQNMPEVDSPAFGDFRAAVDSMALSPPAYQDEQDSIQYVKTILQQFEKYRGTTETALRDRASGWKNLTSRLLRELLGSMGIDSSSEVVAPLASAVSALNTAEDIRKYQERLDAFLRPKRTGESQAAVSKLRTADRSTTNLNAAGLRGGGAAIEDLQRSLENASGSFLVFFHLTCLDMIHSRFGLDVVHDCLMKVSAHLIDNMQSTDAVYHWSDSLLIAILRSRPNEAILRAELERMIARNRDFSVDVGGHIVMLRVPIRLEIVAIGDLSEHTDLHKLIQQQMTG